MNIPDDDPTDGLYRYIGKTHAEKLATRARMIADEYQALARQREEAPAPEPGELSGMERFRRMLRDDPPR